jgi:hypothetical protein
VSRHEICARMQPVASARAALSMAASVSPLSQFPCPYSERLQRFIAREFKYPSLRPCVGRNLNAMCVRENF